MLDKWRSLVNATLDRCGIFDEIERERVYAPLESILTGITMIFSSSEEGVKELTHRELFYQFAVDIYEGMSKVKNAPYALLTVLRKAVFLEQLSRISISIPSEYFIFEDLFRSKPSQFAQRNPKRRCPRLHLRRNSRLARGIQRCPPHLRFGGYFGGFRARF